MRAGDVPESVVGVDVANASVRDSLVAVAWYAGYPVTDALPVVSFRFSWDSGRRVQGQASLVVADAHGDLWPRRVEDALGVAGSRLVLAYRFGATGHEVPLGVWRIRRSVPDVLWQYRRVGEQNVWLPGGGTVTLYADEEAATLEMDVLDVGHRVTVAGTVGSEVVRLADGLPVVFHAGVDQGRPVAGGVELPEARLAAIQGLLDQVGAVYRMDGAGRLEVVPAAGTPVAWRVEPGEGGSLVSVSNDMSDADLANGVTSWRELREGQSEPVLLAGRARVVDGPLRWGGPFGRVPVFRGANLAETQAQVDADAATTLARLVARGDVHLGLSTLLHPGLQVHDRVTLLAPRYPRARAISGRVHAVSWQGRDGVADKHMGLTLAVPHDVLGRLAEPLAWNHDLESLARFYRFGFKDFRMV